MIDPRYTSSLFLYNNPFEPHEAGFDKIFLLAHVDYGAEQVVIRINKNTPTYGFNPGLLDEVRHDLNVSAAELDIPVTSDLKDPDWQKSNPGIRFISSGCMVHAPHPDGSTRLLVIKRDPAGGGTYTAPGGRCGRDFMETAFIKLAQETCASCNGQPLLPWTDDVKLRKLLEDRKRKQIVAKQNELELAGVKVDRNFVQPFWLPEYDLPQNRSLKRDVVIYLDDVKVSRFTSVAIYLPEIGVIDFSRILSLPVNTEAELQKCFGAVDGERFGRKITFETPEFLIAQPLLPHMPIYLKPHL